MNRVQIQRALWVVTALCAAASWSEPARSGIEECNGIRLEDVSACEIRGELDCNASCSELGVYKKACATKLHTVCREDCVFTAEPTCTDECTVMCSADCDRGINVICIHNCFGECVGSCDATCNVATDPEQCHATCEATCDGECDIKCKPVVDGTCYKHCIECCGGSCQAQANMDCQTTCQDESFEECEYELKADCDASCSGDGALFCDDEYVLSGPEMVACAKELVKRNIADIDFDIDDASLDGGGGCQVQPASGIGGGWAVMLLGLGYLRRRTRVPAPRRPS